MSETKWNTGLPEIGRKCLVKLQGCNKTHAIDELRVMSASDHGGHEWIGYYSHNVIGWLYLDELENLLKELS